MLRKATPEALFEFRSCLRATLWAIRHRTGYLGRIQADYVQEKASHYSELGKRADEAMRAKVRGGFLWGRIPLSYARA